MSKQFEWLTEEEAGWDGSGLPPSPEKRPFFLPKPLIILITLLLATASVGYWQLQQRAAAIAAAIEQDVTASHTVLQQAAANGDTELLNTVLSGSDPRWADQQQALTSRHLLTDRWPLGLYALNSGDVLTVALAPDLTEVEVVTAVPFAAGWEKTITQDPTADQVTLQQTAVYRKGEQRWLLAAPSAEFWGEWQTENGRFLTLTYPQRDQTWARRLLNDFDQQLTRLCQDQPDLACPPQFHITIRLDTSPAALDVLFLGSSSELRLPTPTLVGLPGNEAAYRVLRQGYLGHLLAGALTKLAGWHCCDQSPLLHRALLDRQLADLGLRPWPLQPRHYQQMFREPVAGLGGLGRFWTTPQRLPAEPYTLWPLDNNEMRQSYALLDYLQTVQPAISWAEAHARLATASEYRTWLQKYVPVGGGRGGGGVVGERDWLEFMQRQVETAVSPSPTQSALPNQQIQLMCSDGVGRPANLVRYDPATDQWRTELTDRGFLFMSPLPDDNGVLLQERQTQRSQSWGIVWRDGREIPVQQPELRDGLFRVDPQGSDLLLYGFDFSNRTNSYSRLQMGNCQGASCSLQLYTDFAVWSPDGQKVVMQKDDQFLFLKRTPDAPEFFISNGYAPFWLNNDTYGFALQAVNSGGGHSENILVMTLAKDVWLWLETTQLLPALPPEARLFPLNVQDIAANPHNPEEILVALAYADEAQEGAFVVGYDRSLRQSRLLLTLPYKISPIRPLQFSPNGRFLTIQSFAQADATWTLDFYDLTTDEPFRLTSDFVFTLPGYDWSADEQWLLRVGDGYLHLYSPGQNLDRLVVYPNFPRCNFAAWVNSH
ncbi:MAG: hypothetical protein KDE56_06175 [Anaerolineales bacterium]|nr:hypothetical protein [Anaerolineales bacterium]